MDLQQFIARNYDNEPYWFVSFCGDVKHQVRINEILDKKEYLNGKHYITTRPNEKFNGQEFETRRIMLNYAKTILNFQTAYLLKNPTTLSGDSKVVKEFKKVYNRAKLHRIDHDILDKMIKYGNSYEYLYFDNKQNIKSKLIAPEDSYPIYDHANNMIGFVEHYTVDFVSYWTVYTDNMVYEYDNAQGETPQLTSESTNISGLPIAYINENELSDVYGKSNLDDLISILDSLEMLVSKANDGFYKYITGIPVVTGQQLTNSNLPNDIIGGGLNLDDGATFDFKTNKFDHQAFKTLYDNLINALLDISSTPAVSMNKAEISNLSEVSIKLLFNLADIKASLNAKYLEDGFDERFERIRRMLEYKGITFSDDDYNTLDVVFSPSTPKNEKEIIDNLVALRGISAVSIESILENVPYINDKVEEMKRLDNESENVDNVDKGNKVDE
ncbi:phage portal protein [Terrilactibacillus sp. BCM23-1]|uniref:Phage portal protein n=1 Tax=Terrilactibacillus tamarindi TaxID=2599694 RepID=A0A6N8CSN7_9BACI|nr:phage portal protein [Terrilactibacillus tamarindi]MTT32710.1 phage portal protein [Terrilactibacillus tamarindi]